MNRLNELLMKYNDLSDEEMLELINLKNEEAIKQLVSTSNIKEQLQKAKNDMFIYGGYVTHISLDNI